MPEFVSNQSFNLLNNKVLEEINEAKSLGIHTKPVVLGPVSYLMLGKEKSDRFFVPIRRKSHIFWLGAF